MFSTFLSLFIASAVCLFSVATAYDGVVFEASLTRFHLPFVFQGNLLAFFDKDDVDVVLDDDAMSIPRFFSSDSKELMVHFHLKSDAASNVERAEEKLAALTSAELSTRLHVRRLEVLSHRSQVSRASIRVMRMQSMGGDGSAPIPAWDNIKFTAVFPSAVDAVSFPRSLQDWCAALPPPSCPPPQFTTYSPESLMQTWSFEANATVPQQNFSYVAAVAHQFASLDPSVLALKFFITSLTQVPILPPSNIPAGDNIAFTFELESPYNAPSFKRQLASLLAVPVESFNITVSSITTGATAGSSTITFHFTSANAVALADNLEAVPINALYSYLGVIKKSSSAILPPPPSESASNVKWFLIGMGVVVAVAAVPLVWFVRRRRARRADPDFDGNSGYSRWDRGSNSNTPINDRDAYAKLR